MAIHFRQSIVLWCLTATWVSNLAFMPSAQAQDGPVLPTKGLLLAPLGLLLNPAVVSADGQIGYGTQIKIPGILGNLDARTGVLFRPKATTLNFAFTGSFGEGDIQPFIGAGIWGNRSPKQDTDPLTDLIYGTAGVEIRSIGLTTQVNQGLNGLFEIQAGVNLSNVFGIK